MRVLLVIWFSWLYMGIFRIEGLRVDVVMIGLQNEQYLTHAFQPLCDQWQKNDRQGSISSLSPLIIDLLSERAISDLYMTRLNI